MTELAAAAQIPLDFLSKLQGLESRIGFRPISLTRLLSQCGAGLVLLHLLLFSSCQQAEAPEIRLEKDVLIMKTSFAEYTVGTDGSNRSLLSKDTSADFLGKSLPTAFMRVEKKHRQYDSTKVDLVDNVLEIEFGSSGVKAWIKVLAKPSWIVFEVVRIEGDFDSLRLLNLGIEIHDKTLGPIANVCFDGNFGLGIQALSLNIDSRPLDTLGNSLMPSDFVEAGRQNFKQTESAILTATHHPDLPTAGPPSVALITAPYRDLNLTLSQIERDTILPHPQIGGTWGKDSPEVKKSYIFVDVAEETVDEVIRYAKAGGFQYIVTHPFITSGHYFVEPKKFPNGMAGLKKTVEKIHQAGLKAGLHTNTGGISFHDPYVSPDPDERLAKSASFELASDLDSYSTSIPITTKPAGLPTEQTYRLYGPGLHLQVGSEIIRYTSYANSAPSTFVGCERGALGTTPGRHTKGSRIFHLAEKWNHFTVDVETPLLEEITGRLANIINGCEFDWLYLDGAEILSAQGPAFYAVNSFVFDLFFRLKRDVLIQSSYVDNLTLHVVSRQTSNDFPFYAIRKYFDVMRLDAVNYYEDNFCPTELGWWGFVLNNDSHFSTLPEEVEYGCAKSIAYDRAISLQLYQKQFLDLHGRTDEILELFREYEYLRLQSYFPQSVKDQLKEPGCDYKLFKNEEGSRYFRKINYGPDHFAQAGKQSSQWHFTNRFESQPLSVRIRASSTPSEYSDPRNITLTSDLSPENTVSSRGDSLSGSLRRSENSPPEGGRSLRLAATNLSEKESSWYREAHFFPTEKDLSNHRMLGTWVHGDGSGALLNLQLGIQRGTSIDHYVDLDFEGWRYFQFPRCEGDRVFDYTWPYLWKQSLVSLRWGEVDRIALYLNALPARGSSVCGIGPIKALRLLETHLANPAVSIGGRTVLFPVRLQPDEYLEFFGEGSFRHFDANGNLVGAFPISGEIPIVASGWNEILFDDQSTNLAGGSAIVTIVTTGPRIGE